MSDCRALKIAVDIERMLLKAGWILSQSLVNPCPAIAKIIENEPQSPPADHSAVAKEIIKSLRLWGFIKQPYPKEALDDITDILARNYPAPGLVEDCINHFERMEQNNYQFSGVEAREGHRINEAYYNGVAFAYKVCATKLRTALSGQPEEDKKSTGRTDEPGIIETNIPICMDDDDNEW